MKKYLNDLYPEMSHYCVHDTKLADDLLNVEKKHPLDDNRNLKIAVIYGKPGQKTTKEMFANCIFFYLFKL